MGTGAITQYVDVAQLALYAFWVFFAILVYYLTVEGKREGFPLEYDQAGKVRRAEGIAGMPSPKIFKTQFGGDISIPRDEPLERLAAKPANRLNGSPIEPTGNPCSMELVLAHMPIVLMFLTIPQKEIHG